MLAAQPTGPLDLGTQPLSGPVQTNGDIVCADPEFRSCFLHRYTLQVDLFEQVAILGRQVRQKLFEAMAKGGLRTGVWFFGEPGFDLFNKAVLGAPTAVKIDDRMTQNAVEPGNYIFSFGGLSVCF